MGKHFEPNSKETQRPDGEATRKVYHWEECSLDELLQCLPENPDIVPLAEEPDFADEDLARPIEFNIRTVTGAPTGVDDLLGELGLNAIQEEPRENATESEELFDALVRMRATDTPLVDSISVPGSFTEGPSPLASLNIGRSDLPETMARKRLVLPDVDDEIFGFHLLLELGRGAFAKVFLVKQGDLANREVVLKISGIEGSEPQTLAQLQHTNVVPIYSVHEDSRNGLRAVCMPYLGGACLAEILDKVWQNNKAPESGRQFVEALDKVSGPPVAFGPGRVSPGSDLPGTADHESAHTPRQILEGMSYIHASAWIVARLAEGLQHSHERQVIHRDIKPSNILISAEAQPLLLDFNVAQNSVFGTDDASVAGTVPYMAPEQFRAMIRRDQASLARLTHQADIYGLGLVLYEMLSGIAPFIQIGSNSPNLAQLEAQLEQREREVPSVRARCSQTIPWSLESIVRKALAPKRADRYASAAQLAEDLTRFLEDRPLKFAPELSRLEQLQKWSRRHPKLTTGCTALVLAASFLIPVALLLQLTRSNLAAQTSLVTDARALEHAREFERAASKALCMVNTVVQNQDTLKSGIQACEDALGMYQIRENSDWENGTYWQRLGQKERELHSETVRELLQVLASAYVRATPDKPATLQRALRLIKIAQGLRAVPLSKALLLDRARYLSALKMDDAAKRATIQAEAIPVTSAHDMYMLATAHARHRTADGYREAIALLTRAIDLSPEHYWSHFQRALCYQELGETVCAVSDLGTCIGIWPESAWARFNLGYLFDLQGRKSEAVTNYTKAIKHSPSFVSAYFNRGLARLELQEYGGALADFEQAQSLGRSDELVDAGRAMALEGLGRHAEADKLFDSVLARSKATPDVGLQEPQMLQRIRWAYGFGVSRRAPEFAARIFEDILAVDPKHAEAWYGKGMLYMQAGRLQDAIHAFDEALGANSNFIEPLRYRAISLARLGQLQQALADANACAQREPSNPDSLYAAACVASLSARKLNSQELTDKALELLAHAIACGASRERALDDPDFATLRRDPGFRQLVAPVPQPQPIRQGPST